jgi:hypothetical protein
MKELTKEELIELIPEPDLLRRLSVRARDAFWMQDAYHAEKYAKKIETALDEQRKGK